MASSRGLSIKKLRSLDLHQSFEKPGSQYEYYKLNGSPEDILRYVKLQGKTFGEKYAEGICQEYFNMSKKTDSSHDHIKLNKTIEQKSARYGKCGEEWKWQHIEMNHNWDYLLVCGLEFNGFRFYIASRKIIEYLIIQGVITGQGKKNNRGIAVPQEGYWFTKSNFVKQNLQFENYFTEIYNERNLITYIKNTN